MRTLRLSLVVAVLTVAACTAAGGSPSPAAASLEGRTFLSTDVEGHDLVPGSTVRLTFTDGRIAISAGCNMMGGAYAVADGHLVLGQMMSTDMACEEPLMAQDTWVASFLGGAAVTLAGDTLTLGNGDVSMTLTDREVADPDRPLEGTRWILDGIVTGDAVSSIPAGVTAAVTISNGMMAVETGCNTGSAAVVVTDTTLAIGPLGLTRKACAADAMGVEQAMATVLSGTVGYTIEADVLTLDARDAGLMLRAAS